MLLALGWAWAGAVVWLSLMPSPPSVGFAHGDKLGHFAAYGLLMFWFARLHRARLAYAAGFAAMGLALELVQGALGTRSAELADMAANALGVAAGLALALILESRRR